VRTICEFVKFKLPQNEIGAVHGWNYDGNPCAHRLFVNIIVKV